MNSQSEYKQRESEYLVDRLNGKLIDLQQEIKRLRYKETDIIVAEIVLAMVCFIVGFVIGVVYT